MKFQNFSSHLKQENSLWKQKYEELSIEYKNLKEQLHRVKDKLKYSEELVAKQKEKLSGWGTTLNEANKRADSYWDISEGDHSEDAEILPIIIPEGQLLENPEEYILKDLLTLSNKEWTVKEVSKIIPVDIQLSNHLKRPIPQHPNKSHLRQIFEPGLGLFNRKDSTKADTIQLNNSESSDGCNGQFSEDEVEFWMLPDPPTVIDVEKWLTEHKQSQNEQSYETQNGETSQPGTPSSLSSTEHNQICQIQPEHYQICQIQPGATSQPGTPSSSSVSSTVN